ncbi:MAG: hypothetical protein HC915_19585 [Anaerolineae bacterium]|nr:hypothetical protein [Anaerolineae bacterium]
MFPFLRFALQDSMARARNLDLAQVERVLVCQPGPDDVNLSMHVQIVFALFALTPPLAGLALFTFLRYPPRLRSTLALGCTALLSALGWLLMGVGVGLITQGPVVPHLLLGGLPLIAILRGMQLEVAYIREREQRHQLDLITLGED